MTKSTITRERLEEWVAQFDEDGGCDATDRQLEDLIRQSLSALDSEPAAPVAEVVSIYGDPEAFGEREIRPLVGIQQMPYGTKLYRHTQPAPVVQCPFPCGWDNLNKLAIQNAAFVACALIAGEPATESLRQAAISNNDCLLKVISSCRAAMLQAGNSPVIPEGYVMVPKEPTREMLDEFDSIIDYGAEDSQDAWRRLLAAAPQEVQGE
ncbi:TPA: hypothetical protein ACU21R_001480 [Klebsiella pneumoniae subsp. ozaenae]|uniref:hypothetical protein n=1 Tax=Klebsiella pneumoniae TaxID=573 RepID=UPI002DBF2607|nr:hypothetical protein [Klebsiella pneumoniae]MEB5563601.1 hypothetical protein [Klebsiella pneumoniae]